MTHLVILRIAGKERYCYERNLEITFQSNMLLKVQPLNLTKRYRY